MTDELKTWQDNHLIYLELKEQINSKKKKTWTEKKDEEFGTCDIPKIDI